MQQLHKRGRAGAAMAQQQWLGYLFLALASSIWGGMYVVSKVVLEVIPAFTLVWLRYGIGLIFLGFFLWRSGSYRVSRSDWKTIAGIGFIGYFISIGAQFLGTWLSSAHMGALITSATPAFMLILAYWILKEPLTGRKWASVLMATLGVAIVVGFESPEKGSLVGNLILVLAAVTWAMLSIAVKKAGQRYSSLTITTYAIAFAFVITTPMLWLEADRMDWGALTSLPILSGVLFLGIVSTAGAFYLWNQGLTMVEAGKGAMFFFFQPVVGSLLGWLALDEQLDINFFVGGALILVAIGMASLEKNGARRSSPK